MVPEMWTVADRIFGHFEPFFALDEDNFIVVYLAIF